MFFRPLTGPRPERQSSHLDLTVPWGSRQAEVERLVSLGATYQWDVVDEVHTCVGRPWPIRRGISSALPSTHPLASRRHRDVPLSARAL
jgi:hypothetical protein